MLRLVKGDYLFFVASLAPYSEEVYGVRSLASIRRSQRRKMAKYVVGYYEI